MKRTRCGSRQTTNNVSKPLNIRFLSDKIEYEPIKWGLFFDHAEA